ncbi:MAG: hypothetical protein O2960_23930 [Verrucomicrobia bacterium]|nr:hypothetical protein [Verrucomicrobiota bacterium]
MSQDCNEKQCVPSPCDSSESHGGKCCPSSSDSPIDCAAEIWRDSFFEAMKQAQVEVLKTKIQKAWGPMLDKAADAMIDTAGAKWEVMIAKVKEGEKCDAFKSTLRDLWLQSGK